MTSTCRVVIVGCPHPMELAAWVADLLPLAAPVPGRNFDGDPWFVLAVPVEEASGVVREALAGCPYPYMSVEVLP